MSPAFIIRPVTLPAVNQKVFLATVWRKDRLENSRSLMEPHLTFMLGVAYDCSMEDVPSEENRQTASVNPYILPGSILLAALIVGGSLIYMVNSSDGNGGAPKTAKMENPVVPQTATTLPTD